MTRTLRVHIVRVVLAALLLAGVGMSGVVADSLGLGVSAPAHACSTSSGSGGGC